MTEPDLLRRYVEEGSQDAFAELVRRHVDLVYAAARRQVSSPQLAEEATQLVFIDLVKHARSLNRHQPFSAWLYVVTRRTAIDLLRREKRRQAREQTAVEIAAMKSLPSPWAQLEPLIDEAVAALHPTDRSAILLRFFENKSLRDLGAALGLSEDAAQKRVSRALERLHRLLLRRGLVVTASGLAADLSAHVIEAAPAGLASLIPAAATTTAASTAVTLLQATRALTMTTTQKLLTVGVLAAALGGSLYEARVISRRATALHRLQQQSDAVQHELHSLRFARDANARQLAAAKQELEAERSKASASALASADPAMTSAMDTWLQNVACLKEHLEQWPGEKIPELQFLTPEDWLDAAKDLKADSDMDVREALSKLRLAAKMHFAPQMAAAFKRYLAANNQQPPADAMLLAPYFKTPVDPAILQRYGAPTAQDLGAFLDSFDHSMKKTPLQLALIENQPADNYYDSTFFFFARGGYGIFGASKFDKEVGTAIKTFQAANNGQQPTDAAQLVPYLHSAIDPAFIQKMLPRSHP